MQNIIIKTNRKNEELILHLLEENEFETKVYREKDDLIFVLELYGYQVNMIIQIIHQLLKSSEHTLYDQKSFKVYACNEVLFYNQDL